MKLKLDKEDIPEDIRQCVLKLTKYINQFEPEKGDFDISFFPNELGQTYGYHLKIAITKVWCVENNNVTWTKHPLLPSFIKKIEEWWWHRKETKK